jgi:hypothetical protein
MVRMLLVGYCFGIRSERRLYEEVHLNLAYRWFCRLGLEDKVPDHLSFSKHRAPPTTLASSYSLVCCSRALSRFIEGEARSQSMLFPERLEDWIADDRAGSCIFPSTNRRRIGDDGYKASHCKRRIRLTSDLLSPRRRRSAKELLWQSISPTAAL